MGTRLTAQAAVIDALNAAGRELSGAEIQCSAKLGVGVLYPALMELELAGMATSRWQEGPAPRRRLYRLTATPAP